MAVPTRPIDIIEPVMASIPEGWFWMGCETGRDDEKPMHCVWVDAFELAIHQVTNEDYCRFVEETHSTEPLCWNDPKFNHPNMPVVAIPWDDAVKYCEWLSHITGRAYRLPSEAEWERAARGGSEHLLYPWGDATPEQVPNYAGRWKDGPEEVGRYSPNAYGLYNLGDNVHEWCLDWYDAAYYGYSRQQNPRGPSKGNRRASRGGSWRHHIKVTRTAARSSIPPGFKYTDYGFRVARSLLPETHSVFG
jgi:formylglycine-generating enzyme required for sulfatase activity